MQERNKAVTQSITLCPIWPTQAAEKIGKMVGEINQANSILTNIASTGQSAAIKGGFAAETWHAESFNLDAILKDNDIRAFTDRFKNTPLGMNDQIHDIVVMNGDKQLAGAQLKYFQNPDKTQAAFRSTKDGVHQYEHSDVFIGPADQIEGIKTSAQRTVLKNQQNRPQVAEAAESVRDKTAGTLDVDGVKSSPLSKREAEQVGAATPAGKALHEKMQRGYLNKATLQQSARAAGSAAVITTVIAGSLNTFQYIRQVRNGEITAQQATVQILQNTVIAAGDSALKAGIGTASVSIAARSLPGLFTGTVFKRSFANGGIAGAAVCAVDVVQNVVLFAAGKITAQELESRTGKGIFQTGAGVTGASVGAAVGAIGGPAGALVGSLIGGVITTLAMNIALDNHLEKNFALTLASTRHILDNGLMMQDALDYLHQSQTWYADFHEGLYLSEKHFAGQVKTLESQSARLKNKIKNL
ncbi:hypothetical protein SNN53_003754 [Cronobacter sakazakii]|uniref:hypothetical protein n=1 Tax=Cronobacter sakazakii TaxID=28141 RepID=UPI000CF0AA58|nr:hypothetical protein [Cronobacter sakazakii]EJQ2007764.1 hypothetical protein [Cronobacter sakazakii]EJQ2089625.1 hypothetical protein [Cronobacter sakazakii]EJR9312529.1 hypothetical protein [Cronobacter sakazakii]EJR9316866.1 hypothetical protein [Cronobacter sakazakii]EJR9321540.1 hypothetical protein [Cronobacter sakazakii]